MNNYIDLLRNILKDFDNREFDLKRNYFKNFFKQFIFH